MRGRSWVAASAVVLAIAGVLYLALPFRAGSDGSIRCGALAPWIIYVAGYDPAVLPEERSAYREFSACQDAAGSRLAGAAATLVAASALGLIARRRRARADHRPLPQALSPS